MVTTVSEGPVMRSLKQVGRGKIQQPWQRMQTVTSPNNLHTRTLLKGCAKKKKKKKSQGVLLTGNFVMTRSYKWCV